MQNIIAVLGVGLLIIVHELGHLIFAKVFGVSVERFSIGFGREIFGLNYMNTRYSLAILPFGGFVKLKGEGFEKRSAQETRPGALYSVGVWKRLAIFFGGSFFNIIFFILVLFIANLVYGVKMPRLHTVSGVIADGPADYAGVLKGDQIIKLTGLESDLDFNEAKTVDLKVIRDGEVLDFKINPIKENGQNYFGFKVHKNLRVKPSIIQNFKEIYRVTKVVFTSLASLFQMTSDKNIMGPLGIVKSLGQTRSIRVFLVFLAILSLNLGIINLLPFPGLDGAYIAIDIIEKILGINISTKILNYLFVFGFGVLILLTIWVTYKDMLRIFAL